MPDLFKIKVFAGDSERRNCPVSFTVPRDFGVLPDQLPQELSMKDNEGNQVPVQVVDCGDVYRLYWIVRDIPAKSIVEYTVLSDVGQGSDCGVEFKHEHDKIDISIGGKYFTSYVYDPSFAKPYLGPVITSYGDSYTRLDFDTEEHPHHRSVWVAIGDVNGIDMWNEPPGIHGKQLHREFVSLISGPVFGRLVADNVWTDFDGKPLVDERRTITFFNTPASGRFVDLDILFGSNYGHVEFGPTKEAGPLGIRVAESMQVDNGGTMISSNGAIGEGECWGRRANWCDYHGMVGGNRVGIAVFDNPSNQDYPTHWHIRNYGLLAPNNFYFLGGKSLEPGETIQYRYRICFHDGDTASAHVEERYQDYMNPVRVEISGV